MIELDAGTVNRNEGLVRRGRYVNTTFLLETSERSWLVTIENGKIVNLAQGPFVMPRWSFALRAADDAWEKYWATPTDPTPGYTDLFALLKLRVLKAEGDLHPFFANLLYFKAVILALRTRA